MTGNGWKNWEMTPIILQNFLFQSYFAGTDKIGFKLISPLQRMQERGQVQRFLQTFSRVQMCH